MQRALLRNFGTKWHEENLSHQLRTFLSLDNVPPKSVHKSSLSEPSVKRNFASSVIQHPKHGNAVKSKKASLDSFGTWNTMEMPVLMEASIQYGSPIPHITETDVGCSSIIGKRTYQEDRFFVKEFSKNLLCAAVFDGHAGSECSQFCLQHLEDILNVHLESGKDLETVLHDSMMQLHSMYKNWVAAHKTGERSGSTGTICLLRGGVELAVGYIGDSRALLCRKGAPRRLTSDHCPSNALEKKRIESAGGKVTLDNIGRYMVNGCLNMSRSIGDLHLKSYGVIPIPDTRIYKMKHGKDSFLMLSTDGITHVLADSEICDVINHSANPKLAAEALTEQASCMSSEDNLTALVIPLGCWGEYAKSAASMFYSFGIGRNMTKSSRFG